MSIPDNAVEAAARDLFVDMMERQNPAMSAGDLASIWGAAPPDHHDYYRRIARRVLEAASPFVVPVVVSDNVPCEACNHPPTGYWDEP